MSARLGWVAAFVLALAALVSALPQGGARVSARLSQGVIKLGGEVLLIVEVEGAQEAEILATPEVSGLAIARAGAPARRSFTSYVNGRRASSYQLTWGMKVRPFAAGDYTIPPVRLRISGREVQTSELKLTVAEDMRGEELGYLEITPSSRFVVEGQPFSVDVRFGWDARVSRNINFADLSLPWWDGLPGTIEIETEENEREAVYDGITINGQGSVRAEELKNQTIEGSAFRVFRTRRDYLATRSGTLEFPAGALQFGRVERADSFFVTRPPVKRESYYVVKPAFELTVAPLPEAGRPFDFGGAIGQIDVRASTDTRDVFVGDSIKLTVEWTGTGNFEFFEPPEIAKQTAFGDFRVYGRTERSKGIDHRSIVYDLAPLRDSIEAVPPVVLHVFDPEQNAYVEIATPPVPLNVRALEGAVSLDGDGEMRFERDLRDIQTRLSTKSRLEALIAPEAGGAAATETRLRTLGLAGIAGAVLVPLAWLALRTAIRRRRGDPGAPLARGDWDAMLAFLAERTHEPPEAWAGRELRERDLAPPRLEGGSDFGAGGVGPAGGGAEQLTPSDARALTELLAELQGAVYGGRERVERKRLLEVADRVVEAGL